MFLGLVGIIPAVKGLVVRAPKQNCPRCEAVQSFRPRSEPGERAGTIIIFITCTVCRWRQDLRTSTQAIERMQVNERRLLEQSRIQHDRHGTVNGSTARLLQTVRAAMSEARQEAGL